MSILSRPYFHEEAAAFEFLESVVWTDGPVCPHCGDRERIKPLNGKAHRIGLKKCYACRKQFTVKVGTVFEHMRIPLHKCIQAVHLMCCSKKGVSAHQLHRILEITYKSAWFLAHRIREAMRSGDLEPLGGNGKVVEADETYIGQREHKVVSKERRGRPYKNPKKSSANKNAILALVERGGNVHTFHIDRANKENVRSLVKGNVDHESRLHTDESKLYFGLSSHFEAHETVQHAAKEYVRDDVHTNTLEGYFSIFKRGMKSVYQHCREKHLHRYLGEFDFRYNNRSALGIEDADRTSKALAGVKGKRLTYRRIDQSL